MEKSKNNLTNNTAAPQFRLRQGEVKRGGEMFQQHLRVSETFCLLELFNT